VARRKLELLEGDRAYLETLGLPWETVAEGQAQWLIIHDWPVPAGYNLGKAAAAVRIEAAYPDTQIDMVYFHPALKRADGKAIRALAEQAIGGKKWQRWSRHRTPKNPWRPGVDDLSTHMLLVDDWLRRELPKGKA